MKRPTWLQDPAAPSLLLFAGLALAGLVVIVIAGNVAGRSLFVAYQTPALVSGGVGGLAMVLFGAGLANVQVGRRYAAAERVATEALIDEAAALLAAVTADRKPR
jgi:hypothetical protein